MQYIYIIVEQGTEEHLGGTEYSPGEVTLQRESHPPGIKPVGYFTLTNRLADEIIDGVFQGNNVIL